MSIPVVKFNLKDRPEFLKELRKRVNKHFKDNNISKYANANMKFKTAFILSLYLSPLFLMLTGVVSSLWIVLLMWVIMGFGMAGIGLSIMHDANHGAYSKNEKINTIMGNMINLIGGYRQNWKIQHNVLHHSFTNIEHFDDDINTPIMRLTPNQKRKFMHRFQAFYAPFVYGIMTIYWLLTKDFEQLIRYNKRDLLKIYKVKLNKSLLIVSMNKLWYFAITLVLPLLLIDLPWWQVVLGFLLMHFVSGLTLALIFQCAHVIEETAFYEADKEGSVENNWAVHQMNTTSNFANGSRLFSWLIGGINFQIEHHLFPNICHVHYRKMSKIVKETAKEFNVPYHHHKTFYSAVKSHFTLLNQLGTGKV